MDVQTVLDIAIGVITVAFVVRRRRRDVRSCGYPLPPSPKGLPIIANALSIPPLPFGIAPHCPSGAGSDVVYAHALGFSVVVLNSKKAAVYLLEVKSAVTSSRYNPPMSCDLLEWGYLIPLTQHGEELRAKRKMFQQHFHPNNPSQHRIGIDQNLPEMLVRLLETPKDFRHINALFMGEMVFGLTYGIKGEASADYYLKILEEALAPLFKASVPGAFFVDIFPFFKGDANGTLNETMTRHIKDVAASLYAGGTETTLAMLDYFYVAMTLYPDVQAKAQKESDDYLKGERLPKFDDQPYLPYVTALVKELLRWQPVSPLDVPHLSTEDYFYKGYFIPKGTIIAANQWVMLYNDEDYPDVENFKPERYLTREGQLDSSVLQPESIAFDFRRRICLASHIASILSVLSIDDVEHFDHARNFKVGIARAQTEFQYRIEPRSKDA
ncbi:cytochrome P450 [Coprinopsis marcescibilis]|uniref:Cytochrome P450 n=1 Tax=Coprinopsis marcescibilis TaxID=230819 RepID=A0A5C3KLW6_COPMA|nr:cytochrome P450 [Coprinopsis marcescibilis]